MSFGGIGDVAQLVGIAGGVELVVAGDFALNPPGAYVQFGANGRASGVALGGAPPNDNDRFWRKGVATAPNTNLPMAERGALQSLLIRAVGDDGADFLAICTDAPTPLTGLSADVGLFSTAAPTGLPVADGRHYLPANFGRGRNNWVADDIASIRVEWHINTEQCADDAADEQIAPYIIEVRHVQLGVAVDAYNRPTGNIEIVARNRGGVAVPTGSAIVVTALHSIQL